MNGACIDYGFLIQCIEIFNVDAEHQGSAHLKQTINGVLSKLAWVLPLTSSHRAQK